jgi:tetratricopeptide (TPR) repeat protein
MLKKFISSFFFLFVIALAVQAGDSTHTSTSSREDLDKIEDLITRSQKKMGLDPAASLALAQEALDLAQHANNTIAVIHAYTQLGKVYNYMNYHDRSLEALLNAVEICRKHDLQKELGDSYNQVGGVFYNQADYKMAEEYFTKALHIREFLDDKSGMAASLNNVGESFRLKGDDKTALIYYSRAMEINEKLGNKLWISINCDNIGNIHLQKKEYPEALEYFQKQLNIVQEENGQLPAFSALCNLGNYSLQTGSADKAISYFNDALASARKVYSTQGMIDAMKGLSEAYSKKNSFPEAYAYLVQYMAKKDSLQNNEKERQLLELSLRFEIEQKDRDSLKEKDEQVQEVSLSRGNTLVWSLAVSNVLLAMVLIAVLVRKKKQ